MNIGENIKKYRKLKGLTQSELGERIANSGMSISHYENGEREPRTSVIEAIADALEIKVSVLMGIEKEEVPKPDILLFTTDELLQEIYRRASR